MEKLAAAHAHYAAGVIREMNEDPDGALAEYYQAALNDPDNQDLILEVTRRYLQRKEPEKALELLVLAAARPKASGAVFARLGLIYAQQGKTEEAIKADRQAIKRAPQSLTGYQNLFVTLLQNKRQTEALQVLDEASKQPNVGADYLAGLAELYVSFSVQVPAQKARVQERALAVLNRANQLEPADPMLRLRMAENYDRLGGSTNAAQIYRELLRKLPDVPMVREQLHAKLAGIYLRESDRTNAIEQLQAIVRDDPTNPLAYYYLGYLSYSGKQTAEAADYFSKAKLLKPDFAEAYYNLALAQLSLNKSAEALTTLDEARQRFPENFALDFYSGLACGELKDYTNALRHFTGAEVIAKATNPKLLDRDFYFQLGACSERTGDYVQAAQYFQKCLELEPDWPEALNYLGYMWAERGENLDKARELIEKAVKAEPENAAYLDSLAWVLFKQNQPNEALPYLLQALKLLPKPDPTIYDHLGDIYAATKQPGLAREAWKKSLDLEPNEQVKKKLNDLQK